MAEPIEINFPDQDDSILILTDVSQLNDLLRQGYTYQLCEESYPMMVYICDNEITNCDATYAMRNMKSYVKEIQEFIDAWEIACITK